METLELLEELLMEYKGTVLLVSHDRAFLNNVVTSTIVFEGGGRLQEYAGGYDDWLEQRPVVAQGKGGKKAAARERPQAEVPAPRKLAFKEIKELEALPKKIEELEAEQGELYRNLADPVFCQGGGGVTQAQVRLKELEGILAALYLRWEKLEACQEQYRAFKK
jgi:ATP-binding cassette subfamily F protein uup